MASERRRGQRVRYEQRLLTLAVATGLPAVALALLLLWGGDYATRTQWTLTVLLISVWLAVVGLLRERVVRQIGRASCRERVCGSEGAGTSREKNILHGQTRAES